MATELIQERHGTTVIDDSYGFGSIHAGPPEPAEQPRPKDRKLDRPAVRKKFG